MWRSLLCCLLIAAAGPVLAGAVEVRVTAAAPETSSGVFVRAGESLRVTVTGRWTLWKGPYPPVGAEGHPLAAGKLGNWGRLCGRIGSGAALAIPLDVPWKVPESGPLTLFPNRGEFVADKAEGELRVRIEGGTPLEDYLAEARQRGITVKVPAGAAWIDTGIYLEEGQTFRLDALGEWTMAMPGKEVCRTTADGSARVSYRDRPLGQLLGRVAGVPGPARIPLGTSQECRAPASGVLYLESNHLWWLREQQRGEITVTVQGGSKATAAQRERGKAVELEAARCVVLQRCNDVRRRMGLPAVERLRALETAAQGHAEYLEANSARGHAQQSGSEGFTGRSAQDRQRAAGHLGRGGEVVAYEDSPEEALEMWLASVYHRLFLTDPELKAVGLGLWGRTQVLDFALANTPLTESVALCPANGENGVPTSWHGLETPSPIPERAERPVGYTVSAHFPVAVTRVVDAALRGPEGKPVACYRLSPENDRHLRDHSAVFLLPRSPLQPGATYHATVSVETPAGRRRAEWSFTTAAQPRALAPAESGQAVRR